MAKKKDNGNGVKVPIKTILILLIAVLTSLFGYGILRIDKNTDRISDIQKNYVTKEDFNNRMDRLENLIMEKR